MDRWIKVSVVGLLITAFVQIVTITWWASELTANVTNLQSGFCEIKEIIKIYHRDAYTNEQASIDRQMILRMYESLEARITAVEDRK